MKIVIDARESGTSTGRYIDKLIEHLYSLKPAEKIIVLTKSHRVAHFKKTTSKFGVVTCPYKEFSLGEQLGFLRQLRLLKPDLVHFGMVQQPILYRGRKVTTMHDLTTTRFRNPSKNWVIFTIKQQIYKGINRLVPHTSKFIITDSAFVKEDVAKYARVNSRRIIPIHLAADAITDALEPIDELVDKQFIMYVGRPQPHKNLDRLVEAFGQLRQTHPALRLVLAGKKDALYKQLEKRVRQQGLKNVIFTDFVSEGQLRWLYENTAAYVFPSLSEGFGLPGLEAMIQGAPVVSSDATCLPEVYKDGAHYFDPTDVTDMVGKISDVLDKPELAKNLRSKGKKVVAGYSWDRMARQTLDVYRMALEK